MRVSFNLERGQMTIEEARDAAFSLTFHCLSLTFHCLFLGLSLPFPWPFTALGHVSPQDTHARAARQLPAQADRRGEHPARDHRPFPTASGRESAARPSSSSFFYSVFKITHTQTQTHTKQTRTCSFACHRLECFRVTLSTESDRAPQAVRVLRQRRVLPLRGRHMLRPQAGTESLI